MFRALCAVAGVLGLLPVLAGGTAVAPKTEGIPILVYHRFDPSHSGPTTIQTTVFEEHLRWLRAHDVQVMPLHEALERLCGGRSAPQRAAVITVDDGHRSVYFEMFPLIKRYGVPVTLFIYPSAISNASYALTWDQVREMQRSGLVDVQSHTWWHPDFRRERALRSEAAYREFVITQLTHSRAILEGKLGTRVDLLAWPFGIVDPVLEKAARQAGYASAFGYAGGLAHPGADCLALPRIPVPSAAGDAWFKNLLSR